MKYDYSYNVLRSEDDEGLEKVGRAFASQTRIAMLRLLGEGQLTVTEIGKQLGLANGTVLFHLKILEEAHLIRTRYMPGKKGFAQVAALEFGNVKIEGYWVQNGPSKFFFLEQSIPIGFYVNADFFNGLRLCTEGEPVVRLEAGEAFDPIRTQALLLWTDGGRVEYAFSNYFAKENVVRELRISLEICSETARYRNDWKSDITFFVNGRELCTWTCPGDYGGTRGRLNPDWWPSTSTQFGDLVTLTVNGEGTFLNHVRAGDITLDDLKLEEGDRLLFALGNKRDAVHVGGFNLFGRKMGNYEQDIVLTAVCEHK